MPDAEMRFAAPDTRRLWIALALAGAALLMGLMGFWPRAAVTFTSEAGTQRLSWAYLDQIQMPVTPDGETPLILEGTLWMPRGGAIIVENSFGSPATFTLAGQRYSDLSGRTRIELAPAQSPQPFTLEGRLTPSSPGDARLALRSTGPGQPVLVYWRFDPRGLNLLAAAARTAFVALALAALGFALAGLLNDPLTRREAVLLLGLALAMRLISLLQKFHNDPGLWPMTLVWDNYVWLGRQWLAGLHNVGGSVFQQGNFLYLAYLQLLIGPDLSGLYLFNTIVGSLAVLLIYLAGRILFAGRLGLIAGLLAAAFPVMIHYQHTLQTTWVEFLCMGLILLGSAGLMRHRHPVYAILAGLGIGLGTITRSTFLLMLPLPLLGLWLSEGAGWRARLPQVALLILLPALCIAPITYANLRVGVRALTSDLAEYQLFRSNNLNSMGMNTFQTQSERLAEARDEPWSEALERDLRRDPARLLELTIRRFALFWEATDHADSGMIDYQSTGLEASPLLRFLSLWGQANLRALMLLACAGLALGLISTTLRRESLLLGAGLLIYMGSLLPFYVIGRVRAPLIPLLVLLVALGLVEGLRIAREGELPERLRAAGLLAASLLLALLMNQVAAWLPRPEVSASPPYPASFQALEVDYGQDWRLLGYAEVDHRPAPGGYVTFELFWQARVDRPLPGIVSLRWRDPVTGELIEAQNAGLGAQGTPPPRFESLRAGQVYTERMLITLPERDAPPAWELLLGLLNESDASPQAALSSATAIYGDFARLRAFGLGEVAPLDGSMLASWGDSLGVQTVICSPAGADLRVRLVWQATAAPPRYAHVFIHALRGVDLIAQFDGQPDPARPLDAWLPGQTVELEIILSGAGQAEALLLGVYDPFSGLRWPIRGGSGAGEGEALRVTCAP